MLASNVVGETPRSMSLTPTHTNTVSGMSSCAIGTCRLDALATVASRSAALTNTVARGKASRYTTRGQSSRNGSSRVSPRALPVPTTSSVCAVPAFDGAALAVAAAPAGARGRNENAADRHCDGAGDRLHRSPIACRAGSRACALRGDGAGHQREDGRAGHHRDHDRDRQAERHGRELLALEEAVDDAGEHLRGEVADDRAEDAAEETERARFDQEDAPHVAVCRTDRLEHADLTAPFAARTRDIASVMPSAAMASAMTPMPESTISTTRR